MDVILANGDFPVHPYPLQILHGATRIICCDGAADKLLAHGLKPWRITGDLDSLSPVARSDMASCIEHDPNQENNDLSKAVALCRRHSISRIAVLGATGRREDHTLGNISLLLDYAQHVDIFMATDHGRFFPLLHNTTLPCREGQQVSFFALDPSLRLSVDGVKYPVENVVFDRWWKATLNECTSSQLQIRFTGEGLLLYFPYPEKPASGENTALIP